MSLTEGYMWFARRVWAITLPLIVASWLARIVAGWEPAGYVFFPALAVFAVVTFAGGVAHRFGLLRWQDDE